MIIDYKVSRTSDCALIDVNEWISDSDIVIRNIKGRKSPTLITTALEENFKEDLGIKKGDSILITKVAADIALMRSYKLDNKNYYNLPSSQIIGKFRGRDITLENLELAKGKVLIERVDRSTSNLWLPNTSDTLGKIVKVNSENKLLQEGNIIFLKDNIATQVNLNKRNFLAADDTNIVGVVKDDGIEFINESILMVPYIGRYVLDSQILITPDINYEDLDYSDMYNRDLFQVKHFDKNLKEIKKDDIIMVQRDFTTYVYINDEKFFLLNGMKWVEAKII